ncbi:MAG: hemagglutinin repeat-containing protein [Oleispira sp.]|nr:hemagglutinin repeat-containing protein [Oleispira sp.]
MVSLKYKTTTEKSSTDTEERYIGSNFNVGGDASFDADSENGSIDIIGSNMDIAGGLALNAKDINIKAGTEETTSTSSETTRTAGVSYSTNGSGSVNASGSNTDADSYSKTHINSSINAGSLTSTSENLTLSGANVEVAGSIDIDTGNLTIESLQDETSSNSKTEGYNAGMGFSPSSMDPSAIGANENSSNANSQWVNNQTTLIGGTSSGETGEGEVNISADKTTITGAVLASATRNEDGSLTDNSSTGTGSLNLATDELVISNLQDKDHSENEGFNISAGLSSSGSSSVGLTSDGHKKEQTTLATIGGGNITKKDGSEHDSELLASANSDLNNSQEITKDMKTGGLNATVVVDHRLVTEGGRESIAENFEKSGELAVQVGEAVVDGADYVADEIAVLGDDLPEELQGKLGETGERFVDELIREDFSDEQIADILAREKIQDGLEGVELAGQGLSADPSLAERNPDESPVPESDSTIVSTGDAVELETVIITADDPSALEIGAAGLGKVQQELDTLHEENADLALGVEVAIGVATGGPLKEGISQAINYSIEQIAGEDMANLESTVNNYAGGYVTDEGKEGFTDNLADERLDPYDNAEIGNSSVDISDGLRMATGTILGIGGGIRNSSSSNRSGDVDGNISEQRNSVLNSDGFEVPDSVVRRDDDFNNPSRTHLDENDNLVSANPDGDLSTVSHIRGGQGTESQYISTTSPSDAGANGPNLYGDQEVVIDTRRLQEDINSGRVEGVEIQTPQQVQADLQDNINQAQNRYNENPSIRNEGRLARAQGSLNDACRDGECLVSPRIPSEYISQPRPIGD